MSKLSLFLLIATLAYCTAFSSFDWDSFEDSDEDWMPKLHFKPIVMPKFPKIKPINPEDIKNLKPDGPNSYVQGMSSSKSSSVSYVNGVKVEDNKQADKYVNNNGKTYEKHYSNKGDKQ